MGADNASACKRGVRWLFAESEVLSSARITVGACPPVLDTLAARITVLGLYWDYIGVISGLYRGYRGFVL